MNFKIGQEVVCVENHPQGAVKEGEIYTVKDMRVSCCKIFELNVGIKSSHNAGERGLCYHGLHHLTHDGVWWLRASRFKPLDELYNEELNEELNEIFSKQPYEL